MPGFNNENNHSEEAQEILGRIPSWTIRWGVTVIFLIFSVIIIGCCIAVIALFFSMGFFLLLKSKQTVSNTSHKVL